MNYLKTKLNKFIGKEIFVKDTNGSSFGGILKELGEDYCILGIAKRTIIYTLSHIVSVEERAAPTEVAIDPELSREEAQDIPTQMTDE